jgi:hypothetical protein
MTLVVRIQGFPIHLPSVSGISAGVGSVLQQGDFKHHQNGGLVETILDTVEENQINHQSWKKS